MKVSSINFSHNITFKSEPLAYDDEVSRGRRNFIRSHLDSLNFGYSDIYEKEPRLEEYELNKLVKFYSSKPKKINIDNLNIVAKKIDSAEKTTIYRGQSLMYSSDQDLKNLKDAGFQQVIDLACFGNEYKKRVEKAGMRFSSFSMENFWDGPIFNNWSTKEDKQVFVKKFVNFINKMQEGNAYIGCDFGTYRTDDAVMLNSFFNPLANRHPVVVRYNFMTYKMKILYENLSNSDKSKMKWTKEYEQKFFLMLKKAFSKPFSLL